MYKALGLEGKVVVVTGGAGGIGQATIELMIGRGARVAVADIDMPRAQAVAAPYGDKALAVDMDLTDEASIQHAIARVVEHFGRLDILINNATAVGRQLVAADNAIGEMATETWDTFFDTNCRGTMIVTREALPHLIKSGGGAIVNTVSGMATGQHPLSRLQRHQGRVDTDDARRGDRLWPSGRALQRRGARPGVDRHRGERLSRRDAQAGAG